VEWHAEVRELTERLMRVGAVSPSADELAVAAVIHALLVAEGTEYASVGLDPLPGDPYGRANVHALVRGQRAETIVLLGHFDTVGTEDYGPLEPWATDPTALAARVDELAAHAPEMAGDLAAHPGDWLFGRGAVDMKSGVAVNLALIRRLAAETAGGRPPALSVLFLATPDEENESAGALAAVELLARLGAAHGLRYLGALNTDYTAAEHPGDPHRYVYTGTVGKLLPTCLVIGAESHVGQPYEGLDAALLAAELARDLSMDDTLADRAHGQVAPPPVLLRAGDLKERYDVQLPFAAYLCLNVLTLASDPAALLERLRARAEAALARALARVDASETRWLAAAGRPPRTAAPRTGVVLALAEVRAAAERQLGAAASAADLATTSAALPPVLDTQQRAVRLAQRLWRQSGLRGPALIWLFAPPYYPHVPAQPGPLLDAVRAVIAAHPEQRLIEREFYPYISDMSYIGQAEVTDTAALTRNMPLWHAPGTPAEPGSYTLPLEAMRAVGMPVVNFGPYGAGAHRAGERVLMSYSFDVLPRLLWEVIARAGEAAPGAGAALERTAAGE
jgi:arginine utilization protein RocB